MRDPEPTDLAGLAATIETAAEALANLLDPARCEQLAPVSPAQLRVLLLLRARPTLNVNGLAAALQVGASSASRLCDRLEALGLLSRVPDPQDRREMQLPLSAAALDLLAALSRYRRHAIETVLAGMPTTARADLARTLTVFSAAAGDSAALPIQLARKSA
jgi:DNA-binding MarR family transcriptional regulator